MTYSPSRSFILTLIPFLPGCLGELFMFPLFLAWVGWPIIIPLFTNYLVFIASGVATGFLVFKGYSLVKESWDDVSFRTITSIYILIADTLLAKSESGRQTRIDITSSSYGVSYYRWNHFDHDWIQKSRIFNYSGNNAAFLFSIMVIIQFIGQVDFCWKGVVGCFRGCVWAWCDFWSENDTSSCRLVPFFYEPFRYFVFFLYILR